MALEEFIIEVVRNLSSDALALAHRHTSGPLGTPSILEAQWQNEVYRCAYKVTGGSGMWFSPEFGTPKTAANGRIDFYVGTKKWGMEILREGDGMDEHVVPGAAYHKWITTGAITEYVIHTRFSHTFDPSPKDSQWVRLFNGFDISDPAFRAPDIPYRF
ncbi:hypothetical protein GGX14DRAFT_556954 [Mycena pura]|uniref:Uncharacterized protein n=1 Tax=Mycena pura TaxID=153505 RepID=A0AAD6YMI6_9AGAR|nr:hypothetical protein GGX14DRAFT_556954 [Mycena pura]